MFNWLKKLVQMNTTLLLKPEWEVKKSKPKKKKAKKRKKDPYSEPWNGIV
tara:strand:- start:638 stop:787 length:150 start_codon:yes stop_codon:yes gene_type:complete